MVLDTIAESEGTESDADHCGGKLSAVLVLRSTVGVGEAASAGPSLFVKSNASLGHTEEVPWLFARL